ncbi:cell wall hydrolase (plasmid) [Streptomyces sp. NBC_01298]|uniref:SH3 domain-containing protein n=1 Tax=Streptomyces sp. NBC_01298 TaxID=2903817 RepID=UPI002E0ECB8A|nr:cell wall hydrolase [Streptomyces sp. NBC_01298]
MKRSATALAVMSFALVLAAPAAAHAAPARASTAAASSCSTWYVNSNGVNFRTGPGTGYRSVGLLYYPDSGTRVSETDGWVKLRLRYKSRTGLPAGTTAWVSKSYSNPCLPIDLT